MSEKYGIFRINMCCIMDEQNKKIAQEVKNRIADGVKAKYTL